ncbi:MAG: hypothetical protein ACKVPX_12665 [Myxococcaceae bacterium]
MRLFGFRKPAVDTRRHSAGLLALLLVAQAVSSLTHVAHEHHYCTTHDAVEEGVGGAEVSRTASVSDGLGGGPRVSPQSPESSAHVSCDVTPPCAGTVRASPVRFSIQKPHQQPSPLVATRAHVVIAVLARAPKASPPTLA